MSIHLLCTQHLFHITADFAVICYGLEFGQTIQAGEVSEWEIHRQYIFYPTSQLQILMGHWYNCHCGPWLWLCNAGKYLQHIQKYGYIVIAICHVLYKHKIFANILLTQQAYAGTKNWNIPNLQSYMLFYDFPLRSILHSKHVHEIEFFSSYLLKDDPFFP